MGHFDYLKLNVSKIVESVMGYEARWTPSGGGPQQTGMVLQKSISEMEKYDIFEYDPTMYYAEYHAGYFDGLKLAADGKLDEVIEINKPLDGGWKSYDVRTVKKTWDGDRYLICMQPTGN